MDGIIFVNKPKGISSHSVVNKIRRALNIKRVGHTGTLDPLATGLMIICVGRATKLSNLFLAKSKAYNALFELGYETDTLDKEGKIVNSSDIKITKERIIKAIEHICSLKKQIPPKYSAIKINGQKAYNKALKGDEFKIPERDIEVIDFKILNIEENIVSVYFNVSKGTYIRGLTRDIGRELEKYATLLELERVSIEKYLLKDAKAIDEIENSPIEDYLIPIDNIFKFPQINLTEDEHTKFLNGAKLYLDKKEGVYNLYFKNEFVGLGEINNHFLSCYYYKKV